MVELKDDEIKPWILSKLYRLRKWGPSHTSFDNLPKGAPQHQRGKIRDIANELIKEGFLLSKPTGYGLEISLNSARKNEIEEIIKKGKFLSGYL